MSNNNNIYKFRCPKCKNEFEHKFILDQDSEIQHEPRPLTCPKCGNYENLKKIKL